MTRAYMPAAKSEEWGTPDWLFKLLDDEFHFTLDVAASKENTKCEKYFTKEDDGVERPWYGTCWCNPPYGREIGEWVEKAGAESGCNGVTVVMLLPARTDTKWFEYVLRWATCVIFIRGRLLFEGAKSGAPFPSMVVVFSPGHKPSDPNIKTLIQPRKMSVTVSTRRP